MAEEIRIYLEGGGDGKDGKAKIRKGFDAFLSGPKTAARAKKIRWQIIACGSRNSAFEDFNTALQRHPHAFNILLVDSEGAVQQASPWDHLQQRDQWHNPGTGDEHCHLMAQAMEAWLIADIETIAAFFGQGFQRGAIPANQDVEAIDKDNLEPALVAATRHTQKGRYHKIRHGADLIARLNPAVVRQKAHHCDRLLLQIETEIG
jgi:hypothetical protein